MFSKIKNFICDHFDFKIYGVTWLAILSGILIIPMVIFLNPQSKIAYENGLLENIQMLILFIGCWFAIKAENNKKFFYFVALLLGIFMIREVNCGRTLFFAIPGQENAFYSWKDIKYGYLAHPIFGIYIAWVVVYFFKNKLFLNLWNYIRLKKIPIWNFCLLALGIYLSLYAEKATENFVFEESSELFLYIVAVGILWLYSKHKDFVIND